MIIKPNLSGKIALVTGGSRGIGRSIALELGRRGATVVINYLKNHDDPTEIEYYICGPPLMLSACRGMLDNLGVEADMIDFDDFGG